MPGKGHCPTCTPRPPLQPQHPVPASCELRCLRGLPIISSSSPWIPFLKAVRAAGTHLSPFRTSLTMHTPGSRPWTGLVGIQWHMCPPNSKDWQPKLQPSLPGEISPGSMSRGRAARVKVSIHPGGGAPPSASDSCAPLSCSPTRLGSAATPGRRPRANSSLGLSGGLQELCWRETCE